MVIQDKESKSLKESIERLSLDKYLSEKPLPEGYSVSVVGGKGMSEDLFKDTHKKNSIYMKEHWSNIARLPGIPAYIEEDDIIERNSETDSVSVASARGQYYIAFAIIKCTDPSYEGIYGLSARWYAINFGTSQDRYSAFLVNGVTNGSGRPFVQCGHLYATDGTGTNARSTSNYGYYPQPFTGVPYEEGNLYEFTLAYGGSSFGWWMGCEDITDSQFQYYQDASTAGSQLVTDRGTGVFFENGNYFSGWQSSFPDSISGFYAEDFNGSWKAWNHEQMIAMDAYGRPLTNNVITGTLLNRSSACWDLDWMPLATYY